MWATETSRGSYLAEVVKPCDFDVNQSIKCHYKMYFFKKEYFQDIFDHNLIQELLQGKLWGRFFLSKI